jgi:thioredoxin-like negative regulator of GroEL
MAKSCQIVKTVTGKKAEEIMQKQDGVIRLIQWKAAWCTSCQETSPEVTKANRELCGSGVETLRIDADKDEALADKHKIEYLPTVMAVRNGKVLGKVQGEAKASEFVAMVEKARKKIEGR